MTAMAASGPTTGPHRGPTIVPSVPLRPRHGRERYFQVKEIVKSIIFPKMLSRQLSIQFGDQKFASRQLLGLLFFQPIFQGNCQVNCVTQNFLQGNCQVNYWLEIYFIIFINYCDF